MFLQNTYATDNATDPWYSSFFLIREHHSNVDHLIDEINRDDEYDDDDEGLEL